MQLSGFLLSLLLHLFSISWLLILFLLFFLFVSFLTNNFLPTVGERSSFPIVLGEHPRVEFSFGILSVTVSVVIDKRVGDSDWHS